jgi:hypothetical protein
MDHPWLFLSRHIDLSRLLKRFRSVADQVRKGILQIPSTSVQRRWGIENAYETDLIPGLRKLVIMVLFPRTVVSHGRLYDVIQIQKG